MTGGPTIPPAESWANMLWSPFVNISIINRLHPSTVHYINAPSCDSAAQSMDAFSPERQKEEGKTYKSDTAGCVTCNEQNIIPFLHRYCNHSFMSVSIICALGARCRGGNMWMCCRRAHVRHVSSGCGTVYHE